MRISDWSSDVCSSDLDARQSDSRAEAAGTGAAGLMGRGGGLRLCRSYFRCPVSSAPVVDDETVGTIVAGPVGPVHGDPFQNRPEADRKSAMSGKSVSVRVDTGGRSIMKKKTNK